MESRIDSTRAIARAIRQANQPPAVLINASAVGFYGDVPEGRVTETSAKGKGFLADTCSLWEDTAKEAASSGTRVITIRLGIVLEKGGGALSKMIPPFLLFMGGPLGTGKQWLPWIHRDDVIGGILHLLKNTKLQGAVNFTAPETVTMKQFCSELGRALNRPSWATVPAFALKMILGEMSDLFLEGQAVVPEKLEHSGYKFHYSHLNDALAAIVKKT